jgi:hypothetical protein
MPLQELDIRKMQYPCLLIGHSLKNDGGILLVPPYCPCHNADSSSTFNAFN